MLVKILEMLQVKGLRLDYAASQVVTFDAMVDMVKDFVAGKPMANYEKKTGES